MARIRSIKPEFWTNEKILECSPIARLLFIGMWNFADDTGRLPFSPKTLKAQIFPSDEISHADIARMIDELSTNDLITIYYIEEKGYLLINGWSHQKIDRPHFDRSVEILGPKGRGLAAKLLKSKNKVISKARSALESSADKSDPASYLSAIMRPRDEMGAEMQPGYGDDWG